MSRLAKVAKNNDLETVLALLPLMDVNGVDKRGRTALHWAAEHNNVQMGLALIKAGADLNEVDEEDDTPLIIAANENNENFVILLLEQAGIDLKGALSAAVKGNSLNILNLLLDSGANPNRDYRGNESPLISAVTGFNYNPLIVKVLLEHDANVNFDDYSAGSPLTLAIMSNNIDAVTQLLDNPDIDVDMRDLPGQTALIMAASTGNADIVQLLINAGADPTIKSGGSNSGRTAVSVAKPSLKATLVKYEKDFALAKSKAPGEASKRAMIQRRMTTGTNIPLHLQIPQKQIPKYIMGRSAYDELCMQLDKYNTKPQIQALAKSLNIIPGNLSKAALCNAIWEKLTL